MEITFLGTGAGSTLGSKRMKSSILIEDSGNSVLLDLGTGANFKLEDIGKLNIDAIFISHLHIDHINGIFDYLVQRKIHGMNPIKIYSPPGFGNILNQFKTEGNEIDAEVIESKLPSAKIGNIEVRSVKACHKIYAVAYIINNKIIYSGDTAEPCNEIVSESKDAELIIHEATCVAGCEIYGHTSVKDALSIFPNDKLILTHIPSQKEKDIFQEVNNRAKIAYDGMRINV
ncbi:MBL fold metallo-hydrolase [Acidianus brierleyi]|uniref:MBL fold metallo-hydrolase n=1 Tax=Acidianus brierleyi TaxID=41673 RepID=A0A2U9IE22_9CREN|nr:MBL fold metallo-hydrolase [Acidianus brierleyi]AWR94272.1 MBL fold metallo-hydrolase [Acidianus brierleyi]